MLSGMKEAQQETISLDVDPHLFRLLLQYIYGQSITASLIQLVPLLSLAVSFSMVALRDKLAQILANNISIDNCCSILSTADLFTCSNLKSVAESVLHSNFAAVSRTDSFLELDVSMIEEILQSDEITDCDESMLFEATVRWLLYNQTERQQWQGRLLSAVRFPLMDSGYLSDVIKIHPVMRDPERSFLLLEAFEHHALCKFEVLC